MSDYDWTNPSQHTDAECQAAVGHRASLTLTGQVVESRDGPAGPFVMFLPDERFGFGKLTLGIDLDALELDA